LFACGHRDSGDARSRQIAGTGDAGLEAVVDGEVLNAVGHELEAEHEDAEPTDNRYEDVLGVTGQ
jgi:hypothetical protein